MNDILLTDEELIQMLIDFHKVTFDRVFNGELVDITKLAADFAFAKMNSAEIRRIQTIRKAERRASADAS